MSEQLPVPTLSGDTARKPQSEVTPLSQKHLKAVNKILTKNIVDPDGKPHTDEINSIINLMNQSINQDSSPQAIIDSGLPLYFCAISNGEVVGVMGLKTVSDQLKPFASGDNTAEIINAFVEPSASGKGAGSSLVETLKSNASAHGFTEIVVLSGPRYAKKGHPFWTKHFGPPTGIAKNYFGDNIDAFVWTGSPKDLDDEVAPELGGLALGHSPQVPK